MLMSGEQRDDTHYRYGPGVYLTEISPDHGVKKILRNNRDGAIRNKDFIRKTECYVKIYKKDLPYLKKVAGKRNIWLHPREIDLNYVPFFYGYTDREGDEETCCLPRKENAYMAVAHSGSTICQASPKHILTTPEFVTAFSTYNDDEDDEVAHLANWRSNHAGTQHRNYERTTSPNVYLDEDDEYQNSSTSARFSQQRQQDTQESNVGTAIAGAAAVMAVGAAVLGIFYANRRENN